MVCTGFCHQHWTNCMCWINKIIMLKALTCKLYRGADRSSAWSGRKQARKHVRDACDFNNIETWAVIKFFFLQGKVPKEIHTILTETLACFLPGQAKGLSALLYIPYGTLITNHLIIFTMLCLNRQHKCLKVFFRNQQREILSYLITLTCIM